MKLWNVICKLQYYTYIQQKCGQKPKAKWNQSQKNNKNQKPKAKSQVKPKPKAKSQMGMQIGSKLQQIARKSEILAPKCSKYKPEARNQRSQKPKAKSQKPKETKIAPKKNIAKKKYPSIVYYCPVSCAPVRWTLLKYCTLFAFSVDSSHVRALSCRLGSLGKPCSGTQSGEGWKAPRRCKQTQWPKAMSQTNPNNDGTMMAPILHRFALAPHDILWRRYRYGRYRKRMKARQHSPGHPTHFRTWKSALRMTPHSMLEKSHHFTPTPYIRPWTADDVVQN